MPGGPDPSMPVSRDVAETADRSGLPVVRPMRLTHGVIRMRLEFFWPSRRVFEFDEFCLRAA
jgi:hypothetical protein